MAQDKVVEQMKVKTEKSVYLITPAKINGNDGYKVLKTEDFSGGKNLDFPVGWEYEGVDLYLELGERMQFGGVEGVTTSKVIDITTIDPHH